MWPIGNNELRLTRKERKSSTPPTSIDKFHHIFNVCHQFGIQTQPRYIIPSCRCSHSSVVAPSSSTETKATLPTPASSSLSSSIDAAHLTSDQIMAQLHDDITSAMNRYGGNTTCVTSMGVLIVPLFAWYTPLFDTEFKNNNDYQVHHHPIAVCCRVCTYVYDIAWLARFPCLRIPTTITIAQC